jgi:hypothetical protein
MRAALAAAVSRSLKLAAAVLICSVAVLLPYRLRGLFGRTLAFLIHIPFILFGKLARYLMRELGLSPEKVRRADA